MSELSRRRDRSKSEISTSYCFCGSCDRVLYVDADALFCPVCSSPVVEITERDEISLPEASETPSS